MSLKKHATCQMIRVNLICELYEISYKLFYALLFLGYLGFNFFFLAYFTSNIFSINKAYITII
jgi:hypothetical protein